MTPRDLCAPRVFQVTAASARLLETPRTTRCAWISASVKTGSASPSVRESSGWSPARVTVSALPSRALAAGGKAACAPQAVPPLGAQQDSLLALARAVVRTQPKSGGRSGWSMRRSSLDSGPRPSISSVGTVLSVGRLSRDVFRPCGGVGGNFLVPAWVGGGLSSPLTHICHIPVSTVSVLCASHGHGAVVPSGLQQGPRSGSCGPSVSVCGFSARCRVSGAGPRLAMLGGLKLASQDACPQVSTFRFGTPGSEEGPQGQTGLQPSAPPHPGELRCVRNHPEVKTPGWELPFRTVE